MQGCGPLRSPREPCRAERERERERTYVVAGCAGWTRTRENMSCGREGEYYWEIDKTDTDGRCDQSEDELCCATFPPEKISPTLDHVLLSVIYESHMKVVSYIMLLVKFTLFLTCWLLVVSKLLVLYVTCLTYMVVSYMQVVIYIKVFLYVLFFC
jgi:hypothetical protein